MNNNESNENDDDEGNTLSLIEKLNNHFLNFCIHRFFLLKKNIAHGLAGKLMLQYKRK